MDRVAYKPLPPNGDIVELEDAEFDSVDSSTRPFTSNPFGGEDEDDSQSGHNPFSTTSGNFLLGPHRFNLRRLRTILYIVAILLFLVFMAQLSSNDRRSGHINGGGNQRRSSKLEATDSDEAAGLLLKLSSSHQQHPVQIASSSPPSLLKSHPTDSTTTHISDSAPNSDSRPEYQSYLSSVLNERDSLALDGIAKSQLDDLHFPPIGTNHSNFLGPSSISPKSTWWTTNQRGQDKYITVTNYIRAMKSFSYNASITLTTQATTEFMYHTLELCKRWDGPISVAIFSPGVELLVSTTLIKFMRQCLPGPLAACIRDKVTWHLVYNTAHPPRGGFVSYPRYHLDLENYPLFANQDQCPKLAGPEPHDLIVQFEENLRKANRIYPESYRHRAHLPYPINVLRNTARLAAATKFVLASDIELYPSINLVPSFANFMRNHQVERELPRIEKFVFTLPIFEVKSNVTAPKTKQELIKLIQKSDAIFFHKWVCDACQNFPNRLDWLQTDKFGLENYRANEDEMVIFEITQRNKSRDSWEPIFIGTNDDPLYDDRLTWEGRRDKMGQMYEMCLQNYYLIVLGNAFLVHAPGIKHIDRDDTKKRLNFIIQNNLIYDQTIANLKNQYSRNGSVHSGEC